MEARENWGLYFGKWESYFYFLLWLPYSRIEKKNLFTKF